MKTITKLFILFLIVGFIQTENSYAQNLKSLRNKAKGIKVNSKQKTSSSNSSSKQTTKNSSENSASNGQSKSDAYQKAVNYYKAWEQALYPLQHSLTTAYWTDDDITIIEKLPKMEKQLKSDMGRHPEFFKLYPKELKTSTQYNSVNNKNYKNFTAFAMAGDNESLPKGGKEFISFYKRYCYWKKLMQDKEKDVFNNAANAMLEAENARENVQAKKLKHMARYAKALKIVYPNNEKSDYMVKRTSSSSDVANASVGGASYYKEKAKKIHWDFTSLSQVPWTKDMLYAVKQFNFPQLYKQIETDKAEHPEYFKIYPATLPGSGMGCMTKKNVNQFTAFGLAGADEKPPANADVKTIVKFYQDYAYWKQVMINSSESIVRNLRSAITKVEQKHIDYRYEEAVFVLEYAKALHGVCPDNERIAELVNDAQEAYNSTIEEIRGVFSGKFHEKHLQQLLVFKNKPVFGKENEANIISEVKVGESAWITGYFTAVNSMGLPTLVIMDNKKETAHGPKAWVDKTDHQAHIPMFDQLELKTKYKSKAYFTFNLFPEIDKLNYKSHVQYFPHLNFIKWLTYQPSEMLELRVKFGKTKKMADGVIKIDLSGDNKAKLKEYLKKLEAKRLASVTYPNMCGTANATASIANYSDLSKYGKVLRITLKKAGDIMKPWPHDDEIDWNTAKGFMAVEKDNGKVVILALDFRKKPTAGKWKWWSLGKFPKLYPGQDYGYTEFNAVKKVGGGYEILKQNVNKTSVWYLEN